MSWMDDFDVARAGQEMALSNRLDDAKARDLLAKYWAKFYVINDICGICLNTGFLVLVNGARRPCFCPGGRTIADNYDRT